MPAGQLETAAIGRFQQRRFPFIAAVPDRPDGVDHMPRQQPVASGDPGVPGFAAAQPGAFLQQLRTRGAVDRAIDTAAPQQRVVGGIDDRIHIQRRYVPLNDLDLSFHGMPPESVNGMNVSKIT